MKPQLTAKQKSICRDFGHAAALLRSGYLSSADAHLREAMKSVWTMKPTERKLRAMQVATALADIIWDRKCQEMEGLPYELIPRGAE